MQSIRFALLVAFLASSFAITTTATAETVAAGMGHDPHSFVIEAGQIITAVKGAPAILHQAAIVVRDGKIVSVGQAADAPANLRRIRYPNAVILPGLIAADSRLAGQHQGDESIAAGYLAVDAFDRFRNFLPFLRSGVTAVHLNPGQHRLLTGQGAVVKLAGDADSKAIKESADLTINLGVYNPPGDLEYSFPASSDVAHQTPTKQRPASRLGQLLALNESLEFENGSSWNSHQEALKIAWLASLPLRIHADRSVDMLAAMSFLQAHQRQGYVVGGNGLAAVASSFARTGIPVVVKPQLSFAQASGDLGRGDDVLNSQLRDIVAVQGVAIALSPPVGESLSQLRLCAITAFGAGLSRERAIAAITRIPAEILGVSNRIGSLAVGQDADFIVMTEDPLAVTSQVLQVFVNGKSVFQAPENNTTVIRAGTIWVNPELQITDGEILVEDGLITAVGKSVPHPPGVRLLDAGSDAFVTPGFIDSRSRLGLGSENSSANLSTEFHLSIGAAGTLDHRVASAGITTVLLTSARLNSRGTRVLAMKTQGNSRKDRVLREVAGVVVGGIRGTDPAGIGSTLSRIVTSGKRYVAKWAKYQKALAEYLKKKKLGESTEKVIEEEVTTSGDDPVTGTWSGQISGGPLPEPREGKMALRLDGVSIEGRVIEPNISVEHKIIASLEGKMITGQIEVDTGGMGMPQLEAELIAPDKLKGTIALMGMTVNFEATRTDKDDVEFRVEKRTRIQKGRPKAPRIDPSLEPLRQLLEKKIPLIVEASTPAEIREVIQKIVDQEKLPLILLGAESAELFALDLKKKNIGVVLPRKILRERRHKDYNLGAALRRSKIQVAFQSGQADGARNLPLAGLYAVEQGLAADDALAAFTTYAAKMFKLDDRIGTLESGKDADIVIFSGHPFKSGSRIENVLINGRMVPQASKDSQR